MTKPNLEDLEIIKTKLMLNRLNDQSQLTKIRQANALNPMKQPVLKTKRPGETKYQQKSKTAMFKRIDDRLVLEDKYNKANIDAVNGVIEPLKDTRSTKEKLQDDFAMRKLALENAMVLFSDREEAGTFIGLIQSDSNLVRFFVQHFPEVYKDLKDKNNLIDANYVLRYIVKFADKLAVTDGVSEVYTSATINSLLPNKKQFKNLIDAIKNISPPNAQVMTDIQDILSRIEAYQLATASTPTPAVPTGSSLPTAVDFTDLIQAINDGNSDIYDIISELQDTFKGVSNNSLNKLLIAMGDRTIYTNDTMANYVKVTLKSSTTIDNAFNILIDAMGGDSNALTKKQEKIDFVNEQKRLLNDVNNIIVKTPDDMIGNRLQNYANDIGTTIDDLRDNIETLETAINTYLNVNDLGITNFLNTLLNAQNNPATIITGSNIAMSSTNSSGSSPTGNPSTPIQSMGSSPSNPPFSIDPNVGIYINTFLNVLNQVEQDDIINTHFGGDANIPILFTLYYQLENASDDDERLNIYESQISGSTWNDVENFITKMNNDVQTVIAQTTNAPAQSQTPIQQSTPLPFQGILPFDQSVIDILESKPTSRNVNEDLYLNILEEASKYTDFEDFKSFYHDNYGTMTGTADDDINDLIELIVETNKTVLDPSAINIKGSGLSQYFNSVKTKGKPITRKVNKSIDSLSAYFRNNKYK
jgi:hypothetical protein